MMATKTKIRETEVASRFRSNGDGGTWSIYSWERTLYKRTDGRWVLRMRAGAAISSDQPDFMDRHEAIEWIATEARDSMTGYGYTLDQACIMVDGGDAGPGYRDND